MRNPWGQHAPDFDAARDDQLRSLETALDGWRSVYAGAQKVRGVFCVYAEGPRVDLPKQGDHRLSLPSYIDGQFSPAELAGIAASAMAAAMKMVSPPRQTGLVEAFIYMLRHHHVRDI